MLELYSNEGIHKKFLKFLHEIYPNSIYLEDWQLIKRFVNKQKSKEENLTVN
jgi:predicted transcriptional regulator with HTH domain